MDSELRQVERSSHRSPEVLRAQLRTGIVSREWIDVLAFAGDSVAREVTLPCYVIKDMGLVPSWETLDTLSLPWWARQLACLLDKLPPVVRSGCKGLLHTSPFSVGATLVDHETGEALGTVSECTLCGTGEKAIPPTLWWLAQIATWVVAEAFQEWADVDDRDYRGPDIRAILLTANDWLRMPAPTPTKVTHGADIWLLPASLLEMLIKDSDRLLSTEYLADRVSDILKESELRMRRPVRHIILDNLVSHIHTNSI